MGGAFGVGWALFPTDSGGLGGGPPNRRRRARRFFYLKTSLEALEPWENSQKGFEITNYYLRNEHFDSYAVTHTGYKVFVNMR